MSASAKRTNLKKMAFLGFEKSGSVTSQTNGVNDEQKQVEVRLDDECAKVFAMGTGGVERFDVENLHDIASSSEPKQYGEKEYSLHRKQSYPHTHVPIRASRSMRRRITSPHITPNATPADTPAHTPDSPVATLRIISESTNSPSSLGSPIFHITDSDQTVHFSPFSFREEEDTAPGSSSSEHILSDPLGYRSPPELSPERRVQFEEKPEDPEKEVEVLKEKRCKHGRHHHSHHHSSRKFSLPADPVGKLRSQIDTSRSHKGRRISTQPEDLPLKRADRDQLDSHRSDDTRALRRHKMSRPSMIHIGRRDGTEQLPVALMKKMYDHSPHAIFVQLDELFDGQEDLEWKETARWIKYEEDVEEGVDRWGKPHVASLSFHSLLNLRKCLEDGLVILDMEEKDLPAVAYKVSEEMYREDLITDDDKSRIMRILLLRHRHVNEHHHDSRFRFHKKHSYASLQNLNEAEKRHLSFSLDATQPIKNGSKATDSDGRLVLPDNHTIDIKEETYTVSVDDMKRAQNEAILRRIPVGAQATSVLVGDVDFLEQPAVAFIRLAEGVFIPSLIEVNIPVRFIFILLGPMGANLDYHEVGRSISTLMANQQFHNIAYEAENRVALLSAINEFLDDSIVLPPGDWERQALLPIEEIKAKSEAIRKRKENALRKINNVGNESKTLLLSASGEKKPPFPNPLERTHRVFGGLFNDLRRRYPVFKSDICDGFNAQCLAAAIFMYFAALSGAITFGGLMSDKTKNNIGISETLMATSLAGLIFAILSGQPLVIVGTTGPLLLFDESLFQFCEANKIEYLTTRVYIGLWLGFIALFVASLEGSVFVKLFTRFTEEIFSALISLLYIIESVMNLLMVYGKHPLTRTYCNLNQSSLFNGTEVLNKTNPGVNFTGANHLALREPTLASLDAREPNITHQPNTALFCSILSLGTFAIAYYLLLFRNSQFLGRSARRALGDFGVPIAIVIMVLLDYVVPDTYTEKLSVPEGVSPSNPNDRGWLISANGRDGTFPLWFGCLAGIPAMLVYILLFMETHITELIIAKPERKLKKGSGFHLDIVLICLINVGCGFFGTPWICAATVRSIAHVSALTVMSRTHAPGEKPHLIEVKEQRVSAFMVAVLVGVSVLMSSLLRLIPMSVLFGVFLYMGVASTNGIQFFDRIKLFFMPVKHHPQASYVRRVKTAKMHLFTLIQLMCLAVLWIVKSTKAAIGFPFFLLLMVPLRSQLRCIFSPIELRALDGDEADVEDDEPDFYAEAPLPG